MIKLLKFIKVIFIFAVLTLFTQIGGIIYLTLKFPVHVLSQKTRSRWKQRILKVTLYFFGYLVIITTIIPPIARNFGRVPLPVFGSSYVKPLNIWTCVLNRHYVTPELKQTIEEVAQKLHQAHPNTIMAYMDANFPFKKGYPLWPHLSHNDGKKVDLAFLYKHSKTGKPLHRTAKTWLGYGSCETPKPGEYNTIKICKNQGFKQYDFTSQFYPGWLTKDMLLDKNRTRTMIQLFAQHRRTRVLYIEPYLKQRWGLYTAKIGFHGCHSVRHDDHLHISIW